ncbi:MAG: hypothetical protein AAFN13_16295, partial [Bacteroidota bacterium]
MPEIIDTIRRRSASSEPLLLNAGAQVRLQRFVLFGSALVFVYLVAAIYAIPPDEPRAFHFVDERGAVTALSAVFLAVACGFSFLTVLFSEGETRKVRGFWWLTTLALGFLVLDELLQFHERLGVLLDEADALGLSNSPVRGWNDVVVAAYGVVAIAVGAYFLPVLLRYPEFTKLVGAAFFFYVLHTVIDSVTEPPTTQSVILEESAKLFCGQFLALAFLSTVLVHAIPVRRSQEAVEANGAPLPLEIGLPLTQNPLAQNPLAQQRTRPPCL